MPLVAAVEVPWHQREAEKLRLEAEFSPGEAEIGNQYVC